MSTLPHIVRPTDAEVNTIGKYIDDDYWVLEQKLDGVRCLAEIAPDRNVKHVTLWNRNGVELGSSSAAKRQAVADELSRLDVDITLDGELMEDGTYWVFDIVATGGRPLTAIPYVERRRLVNMVFMHQGFRLVRKVPIAETRLEKQQLWDSVVASGGEGVVAKNISCQLTQKKGMTARKFKITKTIDCVVDGFVEGKDSAVLCVYDSHGYSVEIGKCSLIGKPTVFIGSVVEVEYLYVKDAVTPKLVQPRMVRVRGDKPSGQCGLDQIEDAVTNKKVLAF